MGWWDSSGDRALWDGGIAQGVVHHGIVRWIALVMAGSRYPGQKQASLWDDALKLTGYALW